MIKRGPVSIIITISALILRIFSDDIFMDFVYIAAIVCAAATSFTFFSHFCVAVKSYIVGYLDAL